MALNALLVTVSPAWADNIKLRQILAFAAEMAKQGNWREARYRWEQAAGERPDDPRLLNNLAVASEAIGDTDQVERYYKRALELSGQDPKIRENHARFEHLRRAAQTGRDDPEPDPSARDGGATDAAAVRSRGGKAIRLVVRFTLPARLDLARHRSVLVTSFVTTDSDLPDASREFVRFLRAELHKHTVLQVRDVSPPPAIPEQAVDDLLANHEFWRYLGQEHAADLIVSGVLKFARTDASGFQDVDIVSPVTGQKVRETRFVEQERFTSVAELFFIDGATGTLLLRDHSQRSADYRGSANDRLGAFFELAELMSKDILEVVGPRVREDVRFVFVN